MVGEARSYHHGGLRTALVAAGMRLSREGGVEALGLREIARVVGVTPNATYRHFADRHALVLAVAGAAQDQLALAIGARMAGIDAAGTSAERALAQLQAVGLGYIQFALDEPGWFGAAILTQDGRWSPTDPVVVDGEVPRPYQLLIRALDEMVTAGVLSPERRTNAEWACWSTVHGFADLATRGPLQVADRSKVEKLAVGVVNVIISGLRA